MNTPTHVLIGLGTFSKSGKTLHNLLIFIAAILSDLSIYALFIWASFIKQVEQSTIWQKLYWQEPWQTMSAISNSIPIFLLILLIAWWRKWYLLQILGAVVLLHLAFDFPFHADDAHKHFWPLTDWRFHSPLSYWDSRHHGIYVSLFEICLAALLSVILWRRFQSVTSKILLIITFATYLMVPAFFIFTL